ncbi:succinate dehydrogenase assembly factor 2 [Halomonas sp. McH1-25]|uniref:FAD assembly factor SdhE n=1 Tax=unclassified Halomonas TaxID=2609666 RepID=UPI001EF6895C|nr:succinate dehydrogenase assembly factor 2 [Halomonas sp. McH1-25]MCP1340872.1 succinate dehydrogenase assembly factor 2 [Halomonas sp. FL8]MCP1363406.1 succinate dehydrogenase assembly factor 2 [Halomonas sp. BBD45]MCP1364965.1 succinate dehydrogenase assembly factor 2 [Halomonas sp. BBD48]
MSEDTTLKRLYWHSRRGMWELDLLLLPFLKHRYPDLDEADQAAYRALIEEEDQDLFIWLMRREWPGDDMLRRIVKMIVEYAESTGNDQYRTL